MSVCMCMYVCMYARTVCMYIRMHVCARALRVCVCVYVYVCIRVYVRALVSVSAYHHQPPMSPSMAPHDLVIMAWFPRNGFVLALDDYSQTCRLGHEP
jgi:hypothetical protein